MALKGRILTQDEQDFMISNYYKMSASSIGKILGISQSDVSNFWYKKGLKGKQKRLYRIDEKCFNIIDDEFKAYTLGFIASDGCVYNCNQQNKQNIIKIAIKQIDEEILEMMKTNVFKTDKPINHRNGVSILEIVSNEIYNDVVSLGLSPRKTYGNTYVKLNDTLMRHFIRGYFDGDGSISTKCGKDKYTFDVGVSISGFQNNMLKIGNWLEEYNIFTTFLIDKRTYNNEQPFGSLTFPNKISKYSFLKLIYENSNIFLSRKKNLANNFFNIIENKTSPMDKTIVIYYQNAVLKRS